MVGNNKFGALGDSFSGQNSLVSRKIEECGFVSAAVGPHYTCAIGSDGSGKFKNFKLLTVIRNAHIRIAFLTCKVWTWGRATRGQLGRNPEPQDSPRKVPLTGSALDVSTYDGITIISLRK